MRRTGLALAFAAALGIAGTVFAQTTHEVDLVIRPVEGQPIPEFYFEPVGLFIEAGGTIRFLGNSPHHTVTAYPPLQGKPQRVPRSVEPCSSPVIPLGPCWAYTVTD